MNEDDFNTGDFEKTKSFYLVNEMLRFCNNHCLLKLMLLLIIRNCDYGFLYKLHAISISANSMADCL